MAIEAEKTTKRDNQLWFEANSSEIRQIYPDMWVAVRERGVIAATDNHAWMNEALIIMGGKERWDLSAIFIGSTSQPVAAIDSKPTCPLLEEYRQVYKNAPNLRELQTRNRQAAHPANWVGEPTRFSV